ncbi:mucin-17 isoform X2 [Perca flavescens]|uniref:mucin-17 isoform X2 n=1 Tax=Perca flavescens TaxID=8167 RepID=UPI00106E50AD|nr:mucin-17-like isoform X2 [Perca flavescens]
MAAAFVRRGIGLCCINRELCRVVWRRQTALFSSKPSDRQPPRRTHIKKAKPQPAVDVAKLLEQLFSQRRPGTAPPAARPAKASSVPTQPPSTSSVMVSTPNAPPLSKTEPTVSVFPAASSFKHVDADSLLYVTLSTTSGSSPSSTTPASLGSEAAAIECQTSAETIKTKVETATEPVELKPAKALPLSARTVEANAETSSFPAATREPIIETRIESRVEPRLSPAETPEVRAAVVEGPVEPTVDAPTEAVQTKRADSGVVDVSHTAKEEPLIETTIESPVEASRFPVETLETRADVVERPVEPTIDVIVDAAAQKVERKSPDLRAVDISHTATVEPVLETTVEPSLETSTSPLETLENRAALVECAVERTVDGPAQAVQTNSTDSGVVDVSQTTKEDPLIETTIESPVEASHFPVETLESRAALVECAVERTVDATVDAPAQAVQTNSTGPVNLLHTAEGERLIETTIKPSVEAGSSPLEALESRSAVAEGSVETTIEAEADTAPQAVQTNSTDSGPAEEEPLIETIEPAAEASCSSVSEGTIEPTIETEAADNLPRTALIKNAQESAPLPLKNESTVESRSESVAVEEGVSQSEEITFESVTLHVDQALVGSLKTDELLRTKSMLDEKAEKTFQELSVQTGIGADDKAAAETENSSKDESEILTDVLLHRDSLSEDLQEGGSGTLVKERLCHVPAVLSETRGTLKTSSASNPPVGAHGESLQTEEKAPETEAMTLESITSAKGKAEVGGLETDVLRETRNAVENEAVALAKEEKMKVTATIEDVAVFEDTEADILTLDSISEATDAIQAETAVKLEATFGPEQGPRQSPDALLFNQKVGQLDEATGQEAEKESGEQQANFLEAMSLKSLTLAEDEASVGTLENGSLSETTNYLEKESEIVAGEKRMEVDNMVASEETSEALKIESLSQSEAGILSEDLQTDALMDELLSSVSGHVTGLTEHVRADILDDLDPVQRLFLETIREYKNMRRLNGGLLEAEPDYEKSLSEETAKLQRLYGGGDLSSFPQFTFTEPNMDQDSK